MFEQLLSLSTSCTDRQGWDEHSRERKHAEICGGRKGRAHPGTRGVLSLKSRLCREKWLLIGGMKRK